MKSSEGRKEVPPLEGVVEAENFQCVEVLRKMRVEGVVELHYYISCQT